MQRYVDALIFTGARSAYPMRHPELHFAHANGLPSACYRKMLEPLGERFTVRAVPALGTDPRYPVDRNWSSMATQVAESIRERCEGPVVGVGHSFGGVATFIAAHRHPELFRAVVMLDPPVINGPLALVFGALRALRLGGDRFTPARKSQHRREVFASRDEARERLGSKGLFRGFDPECFEDYLRHGFVDVPDGVRLAIPVATEVAIFREVCLNWFPYRRPLRVPGALVAGERSDVTGKGFDERLARRHGLVRIVVPGGHMFPLERPLETARELVAVIDRLDAAGPPIDRLGAGTATDAASG